MAPVLPFRTASGLMMLNVRCDNVFLLGESLLLSVEQGQRTAPFKPGRDLSLEHGHDAKDSVDMVPGLCSVAGGQPPQPPSPQRPSRSPGPHGCHRLLHRRPLLPPPDLNTAAKSTELFRPQSASSTSNKCAQLP